MPQTATVTGLNNTLRTPSEKDKKLPSGSVARWSERYEVRTHHRNRDFTQWFVPVICGGCRLKRPVRIEYVRRPDYDGRCRKCRLRKYDSDVTRSTGSIIHASERQGSRIPVTCGGCGVKRIAPVSCLSKLDYKGYCHDCASGARKGDQEHPSGAVIHWSEREPGVPTNRAKVAFTCHRCGQKSFTDSRWILTPKWSGLCADCRHERGSHTRHTHEQKLEHSGSIILWHMREPGNANRVAVKCGWCGEINFFHKSQLTNSKKLKKFLGFCRAHTQHRAELFSVLQNGDGQKNGSTEKRPPGRPEGTKTVDAEQSLAAIFKIVLQLKKDGIERSSATSNHVALKLGLGSKETGGNSMMTRLRARGLKMYWPKLRDYIWDGGEFGPIAASLSSK